MVISLKFCPVKNLIESPANLTKRKYVTKKIPGGRVKVQDISSTLQVQNLLVEN